ncbi:MAG: hypothetical protein M3Z33_00040 [Actinomycetota bacterium]|nr:hypothetical protein [Actinomycetota bacterium]
MDEDPKTEELRVTQAGREKAERSRAETATEDEEVEAHARRADKAAYLREKLEERAAAEREADENRS